MHYVIGVDNNNNHDDIYNAIIMTVVIARVQSVHLMNVEQRQAAANLQTKPPDLGCESACRLLSSTTTIAIYYAPPPNSEALSDDACLTSICLSVCSIHLT